jgi:hypothetical protein
MACRPASPSGPANTQDPRPPPGVFRFDDKIGPVPCRMILPGKPLTATPPAHPNPPADADRPLKGLPAGFLCARRHSQAVLKQPHQAAALSVSCLVLLSMPWYRIDIQPCLQSPNHGTALKQTGRLACPAPVTRPPRPRQARAPATSGTGKPRSSFRSRC